jgi:enolase
MTEDSAVTAPAARSISGVDAWEVLDSRGRPTVAAEVRLASGARAVASAPAGASLGSHEAAELRDGGDRYAGRGVRTAVQNVRTVLAAAVTGLDAADQEQVDAALLAADGTPELSRLGANAVLAVSVATAIAAAAGVPLHEWVAGPDTPTVPLPMVNIVSGGAHAGGAVDIQDVLTVPIGARSFAEAMEIAVAVRAGTAEVARTVTAPAGRQVVGLVADEGGLGLPLASNRDAIELVVRGIERAGLQAGRDAAIAIDVAATQLFRDGRYVLAAEGRELAAADWVAEIAGWVADFPIVSVEDPCADDDWYAWALASKALTGIQVLGDDLFVTNQDRLERGIATGVGNAILVKPNQNGTLSGTRQVLRRARRAGFATVLSARSGETEEAWLADLAVGWNAGQIKVGSTTRSERTAKWNRLLAIEHQLGAGLYAGPGALGTGG